MPPLTREDKENMVIELYEQNKSRREIAHAVRMNFSDIKEIIDRRFGTSPPRQTEGSDLKLPSGETNALKLFKKDYEPVEVAIKLNLPLEEVNAMYARYCHSKGLGEFLQVHEKMKPCLQSVLELNRVMEKHHMSTREILKIIKSVIDNPFIDFDYSVHNKRVMEAKEELDTLYSKITQAENYLSSMNSYPYYKPWQPPLNPWLRPLNW
jgi:hypothetical protein